MDSGISSDSDSNNSRLSSLVASSANFEHPPPPRFQVSDPLPQPKRVSKQNKSVNFNSAISDNTTAFESRTFGRNGNPLNMNQAFKANKKSTGSGNDADRTTKFGSVGRGCFSEDDEPNGAKAKRADSGVADVFFIEDYGTRSRRNNGSNKNSDKNCVHVKDPNNRKEIEARKNGTGIYKSNRIELKETSYSHNYYDEQNERVIRQYSIREQSKSVTDIYQVSTVDSNIERANRNVRKRLFTGGAYAEDLSTKNYSNSMPRFLNRKSTETNDHIYESRRALPQSPKSNDLRGKEFNGCEIDVLSNDFNYLTLPATFSSNRFPMTDDGPVATPKRQIAGMYKKKGGNNLPLSPDKQYARREAQNLANPRNGNAAIPSATLRSTSVQENSTGSSKKTSNASKSKSFAETKRNDAVGTFVSFEAATEKLKISRRNIDPGFKSSMKLAGEGNETAMAQALSHTSTGKDQRHGGAYPVPMVTLEPGSRPVMLRPRSTISSFFRRDSRSSQHSTSSENGIGKRKSFLTPRLSNFLTLGRLPKSPAKSKTQSSLPPTPTHQNDTNLAARSQLLEKITASNAAKMTILNRLTTKISDLIVSFDFVGGVKRSNDSVIVEKEKFNLEKQKVLEDCVKFLASYHAFVKLGPYCPVRIYEEKVSIVSSNLEWLSKSATSLYFHFSQNECRLNLNAFFSQLLEGFLQVAGMAIVYDRDLAQQLENMKKLGKKMDIFLELSATFVAWVQNLKYETTPVRF